MFYFTLFDSNTNLLLYHNVQKKDNYILLKKDAYFGTFRFPLLDPKWLKEWVGIDVIRDQDIKLAILDKDQVYQVFNQLENRWEASSEPVYYFARELRPIIGYWTKGIIFEVFLNRINGNSLLFKELLIGYEIEANLLDYTMRFALPDLLTRPYRLVRTIALKPDNSIPIPLGFRQEDLVNTLVKVLDPTTKVSLLSFDYYPSVEFIYGGENLLSRIPAIAIRFLDVLNKVRLDPIPISLRRMDDVLIVHNIFQYDQQIEIIVMAIDYNDLKQISEQIITLVNDQRLDLPPFAQSLYMRVIDTADLPNLPGELSINKVYSRSLKVNLYKIIEGQSTESYPSIESIEIGFNDEVYDVSDRLLIPSENPIEIESCNTLYTDSVYAAGVTIQPMTFVVLVDNKLYPADIYNLDHATQLLGLVGNLTHKGVLTSVIIGGEVEYNWSFDPDRPLFLGENGQLTQIPNLEATFFLEIGEVVTKRRIILKRWTPIILS